MHYGEVLEDRSANIGRQLEQREALWSGRRHCIGLPWPNSTITHNRLYGGRGGGCRNEFELSRTSSHFGRIHSFSNSLVFWGEMFVQIDSFREIRRTFSRAWGRFGCAGSTTRLRGRDSAAPAKRCTCVDVRLRWQECTTARYSKTVPPISDGSSSSGKHCGVGADIVLVCRGRTLQ